MSLIDRQRLISALVPPFDPTLCPLLIDEFISLEKRFIQRDWEPAQLDGGQFSEIAARIIYIIDSGIFNLSKRFDDCAKYIENDSATHLISPRHNAIHIIRALRTVYKFRSQRGAVHISPTYKPNHMDSKLIIECVRWVMNEMLRIFWQGDRETVARAIRELLQFDVPSIGVFGGNIIVQRTDLTAEEEVLLLLHYAGDAGFSRNQMGKYAKFSAPAITRSIQRLISQSCRQAIRLSDGNYRLTDLGSKRIREQLASKLVI